MYRCGEQTFRDFSLYVLDNCSDEPVPDDIRHWPDLHLIESEKNLGFAAGCNLLLREALDSTWSLLLNPDAAADPTWFETMVRAGEQFPDDTFFCSRLLSEDRQSLDGDGDCYHISGLVWRQGHGKAVPDSNGEKLSDSKGESFSDGPGGRHGHGEASPSSHLEHGESMTDELSGRQEHGKASPNIIGETNNGYQEVFSACAAAAMYRTSTVLEAGGFDEDFFCYVEDVDLGFRLRLRGERCLLVPDAVVTHAGGAASGGQRSRFATYHGHRNLVWCFIKNMPTSLLILSLPLHLLMTLILVIRLCFHGQLATILASKRDALKLIPAMWRKRREIHADRKVSLFSLLSAMQFMPWTSRYTGGRKNRLDSSRNSPVT